MELRWTAGAATAALYVGDGMARVELHGPLTAATMNELGAYVGSSLEGVPNAHVMLIDLRGAVVALDTAELIAFATRNTRKALRRPAILLVTEALYELFSDYCCLMCAMGIVRTCTTDYGLAQEWAWEMGRVERAQARFVERRREIRPGGETALPRDRMPAGSRQRRRLSGHRS